MKPLEPLDLPLSGTRLIEASAGTGKTYTITTLVLRLMLERGLSLDQILVVTYTRAATAELRHRVRARVGELYAALDGGATPPDPVIAALVRRSVERDTRAQDRRHLERALFGGEDAAIFTIHGFCQRVLSDFAFESDAPFALELMSQSQGLIAEIARDYWTRATYRIEEDLYRLLQATGPAGLESLIARTLHGPVPAVVPPLQEGPRPDPGGWRDALARLRDEWEAARPALYDAVRASKLGAPFAAKGLPSLFEHLEAGFAAEAPVLPDSTWQALGKLVVDLPDRAEQKGKPCPRHPLLERCQQLYREEIVQREWLRAQWRQQVYGAITFARAELERRTRQRSATTFDQLLQRVAAALEGQRGEVLARALGGRYRAALVDEFQDTDPQQYAIVRRAFGQGPLLLIGDPKQAIYGFRGADLFAYLKARSDAGEAVYSMDTNYRSDPTLLAGLNHLYAGCAEPFALPELRYTPVRAAPDTRDTAVTGVELLWVTPQSSRVGEQRTQVAEGVATDIVRSLTASDEAGSGREANVHAADIAVLCRTNAQARSIQDALARRGVPCILQGDSSVFDTPDALELERLLSALSEPHDARAVRGALSGMYLGLDAQQMEALDRDVQGWERHHERLLQAHRIFRERGFVQALRRCFDAYRVDARLLSRSDGARRWTNVQHLTELLQEAAIEQRLGPAGLLRWLRTMRTDLAMRGELLGEEAQLRLESHADAVRVTTVHRSKGLEYPLVYLPFAWESCALHLDEKSFPIFHPSGTWSVTLDLQSDDRKEHERLAEHEKLSESLRLLYVGLTRAAHAVRVVCGPLHGADKSALLQLLAPEAAREPEALHGWLAGLAETSAGSVTLRTLPEPDPQRLSPRPQERTEVAARRRRRRVRETDLVSSFTALTRGEHGTGPVDEGLDHDGASFEGVEGTGPGGAEAGTGWAAIPRGPAAGTTIHTLLERVDFDAEVGELEAAALELLPERGMDPRLAPVLAERLHSALHTPLDASGLTLASVPSGRRVSELEFVLRTRGNAGFDIRGLKRELEAHAAPPNAPGYPGSLLHLPQDALLGYLRGFVDLVFEHAGRFYVVDFKTNELGPLPSSYEPLRLREPMAHHHYYLQYLLYGVAVHRYLQARVRDYGYDTHFGGVFYLFLRGMDRQRGPRAGVFFDRPSAALMASVDELLGRERGATWQ